MSAWHQRCRWQVAARIAFTRLADAQVRRRAIHAFSHWLSVARALAALETRQRLQIEDLMRLRRGMLCRTVVAAWHEEAVQRFAQAADRRRSLRNTWLPWARLAAASAAASLAVRSIDEARAIYGARSVLSAWCQRCRWQVAARLATMRFVAVQVRRHAVQAFNHWLAVARALAALETRQRLQVNDLRRLRRSVLCKTIADAWHEEAVRARCEAHLARAGKLFRCWQLYAKEQKLLQRYLNQCSSSSFTGARGSANNGGAGGDVQPADFERLYEQMAALRWD